MITELMPKRFELLPELVPQARVIALLVNLNNAGTGATIRDLEKAQVQRGCSSHREGRR
jgi:hypothetical protein